MPCRQSRLGGQAPDILFNSVERCDLFQPVFGDRCRARLCNLVQFAPRMSPTISECHLVIGAFEQTVISRIAINLKDAGEAFQNVISILARSPWRIGKGDAGRGRAAPRPIIAGQCPEVSGFGFAFSGFKHWCAGLVYYPAGDCGAICREGINNLVDRFRSVISASNTGRGS